MTLGEERTPRRAGWDFGPRTWFSCAMRPRALDAAPGHRRRPPWRARELPANQMLPARESWLGRTGQGPILPARSAEVWRLPWASECGVWIVPEALAALRALPRPLLRWCDVFRNRMHVRLLTEKLAMQWNHLYTLAQKCAAIIFPLAPSPCPGFLSPAGQHIREARRNRGSTVAGAVAGPAHPPRAARELAQSWYRSTTWLIHGRHPLAACLGQPARQKSLSTPMAMSSLLRILWVFSK